MKNLNVPVSLESFVKDISYFENDDNKEHKLPFYADGFPGIIYSKSQNPFYLKPRNKQLSDFYLYGQTIKPISLDVLGSYRLVCMRLYPFAVRILLEVDSKVLNDDCFDLQSIDKIDTANTLIELHETNDQKKIVQILEGYFHELLKFASANPDYRIKLATNLILKAKGNITIKEVRERLAVTERTLERNFVKEIGVTPKQFAKIIQVSSSINQITENDYVNLTDISYKNAFADQSHFIRSFKKFTGKTPKEFQKEISI